MSATTILGHSIDRREDPGPLTGSTPFLADPLGVKGIGESGTTGSISAVWNAVVDALAPYGIDHLDPPFTPEKVWRALRSDPDHGRTARPA
ncbi:MAG: hypothetical protein U5K29_11495 [Acidimicrobiales bacterium]|nr:hypothetical protein [Acidimicrobiales bacterium]